MSFPAHADREFDLDDLFELPDDGLRYQVIDGALIVNAAPSPQHQRISFRLSVALSASTPDGYEMLPAVAWHIGPGQVPEPDLMVVRRELVGAKAVEGPPLLVVEILSTNQGMDTVRKRELYATAGAAWYWLVDPAEPSVSVLRLDGTTYVETERHAGPGVLQVGSPLTVAVRLDDLA